MKCVLVHYIRYFLFFFFKQKTAYEMRISDWSSDVCSSDLRLAAQLPSARHAINLCENRYRFMLAFAAICVRGQTNLLPSNATPDAIADLQLRYPDSCVLRDAQVDDSVIAPANPVPSIAAATPTPILFTPASTAGPPAHP